MSDFSDAQVGDKVWDFVSGWSTITIVDSNSAIYPIMTDLHNSYTIDGKAFKSDTHTRLFWDEIKFDIPPKPKRKVKKVLHGWVNVYEKNHSYANSFYSNRTEADIRGTNSQGKDCRAACVEINQEYEVEE